MSINEILAAGNYRLIDVREPMELIMDGEIPSAISIPLGEIENRIDEVKNLEGPIIVFCKAGKRAEKAIEKLSNAGIENLYNGGGYSELKGIV